MGALEQQELVSDFIETAAEAGRACAEIFQRFTISGHRFQDHRPCCVVVKVVNR
ncbi:hypothetical protein M378DRAFT_162263 [Amanita muscaria Koide BX008]|uniref:Uncharacterized protein n=1 Tax=Amanita muscaria (strain Koide BX008) TaxID=946122 RepID=A0A0C2WU76_AMAMK|nr:hypothetical protein M378DRAFT_162263 [Amanita muscaria Koide BX008]